MIERQSRKGSHAAPATHSALVAHSDLLTHPALQERLHAIDVRNRALAVATHPATAPERRAQALQLANEAHMAARTGKGLAHQPPSMKEGSLKGPEKKGLVSKITGGLRKVLGLSAMPVNRYPLGAKNMHEAALKSAKASADNAAKVASRAASVAKKTKAQLREHGTRIAGTGASLRQRRLAHQHTVVAAKAAAAATALARQASGLEATAKKNSAWAASLIPLVDPRNPHGIWGPQHPVVAGLPMAVALGSFILGGVYDPATTCDSSGNITLNGTQVAHYTMDASGNATGGIADPAETPLSMDPTTLVLTDSASNVVYDPSQDTNPSSPFYGGGAGASGGSAGGGFATIDQSTWTVTAPDGTVLYGPAMNADGSWNLAADAGLKPKPVRDVPLIDSMDPSAGKGQGPSGGDDIPAGVQWVDDIPEDGVPATVEGAGGQAGTGGGLTGHWPDQGVGSYRYMYQHPQQDPATGDQYGFMIHADQEYWTDTLANFTPSFASGYKVSDDTTGIEQWSMDHGFGPLVGNPKQAETAGIQWSTPMAQRSGDLWNGGWFWQSQHAPSNATLSQDHVIDQANLVVAQTGAQAAAVAYNTAITQALQNQEQQNAQPPPPPSSPPPPPDNQGGYPPSDQGGGGYPPPSGQGGGGYPPTDQGGGGYAPSNQGGSGMPYVDDQGDVIGPDGSVWYDASTAGPCQQAADGTIYGPDGSVLWSPSGTTGTAPSDQGGATATGAPYVDDQGDVIGPDGSVWYDASTAGPCQQAADGTIYGPDGSQLYP